MVLWFLCWLGIVAVAGTMVYVVSVLIYIQIRWLTWLRDVPGPPRECWHMGNLRAFLRRNAIPVCREWAHTFGGAVRFWAMFGEPRLMLTDPVGLDHVLRKRAYAFPKLRLAQRLIGGVMGNGLLVAEGEVHRRQRRAIQPGFHTRAIKRLTPVFQQHAFNLLSYLRTQAREHDSHLIDVYTPLSAAALDALGDGALGASFGALASLIVHPNGIVHAAHPLTAALDRTLRIASHPSKYALLMDTATLYFPILEHIPIGLSSHAFRREARVLFDLAGSIVDDAQARIRCETHDTSPDILASLLRANANAKRARSGEKKHSVLDHAILTDAELHAQVSTFIFAGHETTATQMAWLLLFLAKDQRRQQTLREAIGAKRAALGLMPHARAEPTEACERALSAEELEDIPYLDWCVRECLRLQAAIHTTSRVATDTDWIPLSNGRSIQVHRGMIVLIPLTSIMTSEHHWGADPEEFRPERWAEPTLNGPRAFPAHNGLSFLMGPRACIGSAFALLEMKVFIATVLSELYFEWDGRPIVPKLWVVARPFDASCQQDACILKIRRISS